MKNKNLRLKVRENCNGMSWSVGVFEGKKHFGGGPYKSKSSAVRWAKKIAEQTGIPFHPEIIKRHGC